MDIPQDVMSHHRTTVPLTRPLLRVAIYPPLPRIPPLLAVLLELYQLLLFCLRQHCYVVGAHAWSPVEALDRTFAVVPIAGLFAMAYGAVFDREGAVFAADPAVFEDVAHCIVVVVSMGK